MYIKSCHIENFGKLQDVHFEFSRQLNVIKEENGWGKSTLAAFIRVMFYGFANEGKRSELEKERKRYAPWQGGVYGGQLVFEQKGKTYEIVRTFGKKEKEDTFELYDADTHLLSEDFSTRIGEELFGLDAESYTRSVYVAQQDCKTVSTDGIHAKIGNLTGDTEDISRFEIVQKQMTDLLNKLSPRRKTGEIKKLKTELEKVETEILQEKTKEQELVQLQQFLTENINKKSVAQKQLKEVQKEIENVKEQKVLEIQRESYEALCKKVKEQQEIVERESIYFPKGLLTEKEWQEYKIQVHALEEEQKRLHQFALTQEEENNWKMLKEKFTEKPPENVEIERQIVDCQECSQQQHMLLEKQNLCKLLQTDIEKFEQKKQQKEKPDTNASGWNICMIVGVILGGVGILFLFLYIFVALPFIVIGAGIFGKGWGERQQMHKKVKQMQEAQTLELEESIKQKTQKIKDMQGEIEQLQKNVQEKELLMQHFFERCHMEYRKKEALEQLFQLKSDSRQYLDLEAKVQTYEWSRKKCIGFFEQLSEFLKHNEIQPPKYDQPGDDCFTWQLQEWSEHRVAYKMAQKSLQNTKEEAEKFAQMHKFEGGVPEKKSKEADLQKEKEELSSQIETLGEEKIQLNQQIYQCAQRVQRLQEKEQEAEAVRERIAELQQKYSILQLTQKYLIKSCESLTAKYMEPVMKGFRKYYQILTGKDALDWQLDANSTLSHKEEGKHRQTGWLSSGWQDLTGICLRMAFVDAMYTGEKPVLLFDDPFVNLDEKKIEGGLVFLQEASKEYQILYLTCHESRTMLEEKK